MDRDNLSPYEVALLQFDEACEHMTLRKGVREMLRTCKRELTVNFPVVMDNGKVQMFTGYRVHHSTIRGPTKGGIRYHPEREPRRGARPGHVDDLEVRRREHPLRRRQGRRHRRPASSSRSASWSG